jgi:ATP-dependent Clp protease protease subunit
MSIRSLPAAREGRPTTGVSSYLAPRALDRWSAGIRAADDKDERSISVFDVIGQDYWSGEGVTAKRVAAALRSLGKGPVTVNVNSPGGDMFEGLAIYNLLREHSGEVTVKVLGLAASAASIIAMAGDTVQIARAGFLMIHNCWVVAIGNRHDLREVATLLEPFDAVMGDIYSARTKLEAKAIGKLMDAESWIGGSQAVEDGFADELLPSDQVRQDASARASVAAVRRMESALRASGMSRDEAMRLISDFKSGPSDSAGSGASDSTEPGPSDSAGRAMQALSTFSLPTF